MPRTSRVRSASGGPHAELKPDPKPPRRPEPSASSRGTPSKTGRAAPLREQSDDELLAGIRERSEAHFTTLYERYFPRVYAFVQGRIRNHADAEEIVQETFTAVYRSIESYRGQSSLLSWIYGIAKNTVNNSLRRARNEGERLQAADPSLLRPCPSIATGTPEEQLTLQRCARSMRENLESVSEWQTEIFVMRHIENLSIPEISQRTQRSSDAVRSSLYRVKRLLVESADPDVVPL